MTSKTRLLVLLDEAPEEDLYEIAVEAVVTLLDNRGGDYKRFVEELCKRNETVAGELGAWLEDKT